MQYKRILMSCLIVILILCTSMVSIGATAEATPSNVFELAVEVTPSAAVQNDNFVLQAGDSLTVSISINNNPGIAVTQLEFEYDATALTYVEYECGDIFAADVLKVEQKEGKLKVYNKDYFDNNNYDEDGTIVTFTFTVNETAHGAATFNTVNAVFMNADYAMPVAVVNANTEAVNVHKYTADPAVEEATCQHGTITTYTCETCEDELVLNDGVIGGHTYGDWTVDTEATCTEDGVEKQTCIYCDDEATRPIVAGGHAYGEWVVDTDATCTEAGVEKKTCANCGDVQTQAIESLGHDYSTEWTVDLEATCENPGSKSNHCTRCDDKANVTEITALGHNYGDWALDKAPTCTGKGLDKRTCSRCNGAETRDVAALGHKAVACPEVEPTTEAEGSTGGTCCSVCGEILTAPTVLEKLDYTWIYILIAVVVVVAIGGGVCAYFFIFKKKATAVADDEVSVTKAFGDNNKAE